MKYPTAILATTFLLLASCSNDQASMKKQEAKALDSFAQWSAHTGIKFVKSSVSTAGDSQQEESQKGYGWCTVQYQPVTVNGKKASDRNGVNITKTIECGCREGYSSTCKFKL